MTPIQAVPGLFISDRFAAQSTSLLAENNISRILSVVRWEDLVIQAITSSTSTSPDPDPTIERKHIDLDDQPTDDLLRHLDEIYDWIREALSHPPPLSSREKPSEPETDPQEQNHVDTETDTDIDVNINTDADAHPHLTKPTPTPKRKGKRNVLVHCDKGISRSGSVIVAYLMKSLSLPFAHALSLARESHSLISPNTGFEYQLRIWERCGYEVFVRVGVPKDEYRVFKEGVGAIFERRAEEIPFARKEWLRGVVGRLEDWDRDRDWDCRCGAG